MTTTQYKISCRYRSSASDHLNGEKKWSQGFDIEVSANWTGYLRNGWSEELAQNGAKNKNHPASGDSVDALLLRSEENHQPGLSYQDGCSNSKNSLQLWWASQKVQNKALRWMSYNSRRLQSVHRFTKTGNFKIGKNNRQIISNLNCSLRYKRADKTQSSMINLCLKWHTMHLQ